MEIPGQKLLEQNPVVWRQLSTREEGIGNIAYKGSLVMSLT